MTAEQARECKPGVVYRDTTEWPEHYSSTVNLVEQGDDGGQIEARHKGEWFRKTPELLDYIESAKEPSAREAA